MKQSRITTVIGMLAGLAILGGAAWYLFRPSPSVEDAVPTPPAVNTTAGPAQSGGQSDASSIATDQPEADVHAVDPTLIARKLPPLEQSDAAAWSMLTSLFNPQTVLDLIVQQQVVQRAVTLIDGLTQAEVDPTVSVLRPVPGAFRVAQPAGGQTVISLINAQRYGRYVDAFVAADAHAIVQAYRAAYPLFQAAYVELGYPHGQFNARLIQVIDHLLATPRVSAPVAVRRDERGRYEFSDPQLQSRSIGQKALLRMAPEQADAVKDQLRKIRTALLS